MNDIRTAFVKAISELASENENVILITGDLGFTVFEEFKKNFPQQFINIGVSEQNMISVATGLALTGNIVFAYSIAPFATFRCYEQIRNDVCFHNANVKIVGVGGGFSYGIMGSTHHALEDIAVMRVLPEMKVICPGDPSEVEAATYAIAKEKGPFYLRLGKKGEKNIHKNLSDFKIGKAIKVKEGKDLTLASTGNMLETAINVSEKLAEYSIDARVLSFHTVKPLDKETILSAIKETGTFFTLEEHFYEGGFGSACAEFLSERNEITRNYFFKRFAVKNEVFKICGTQEYLKSINNLTAEQIRPIISAYFKSRLCDDK